MVPHTHAVIDPSNTEIGIKGWNANGFDYLRAVMIHLDYATTTHTAVMRTMRLESTTSLAELLVAFSLLVGLKIVLLCIVQKWLCLPRYGTRVSGHS